MDLGARIIAQARAVGAAAAGIARAVDLLAAPSYAADAIEGEWPEGMDAVLVWAHAHPRSEPVLDWWNYQVPGYTPGNRALIEEGSRLQGWMHEELGIGARPLPYHVERGGVFLKDAAVLAGLGIIGRHNLLITPEHGTRVRLRAMLLGADLEPTGPIQGFDPCDGCPAPCLRACPRDAFERDAYSRSRCQEEMQANEAAAAPVDGAVMGIDGDFDTTKYCRRCELACPVGG